MSFLQPKALQLILRDFYRAMGQDGKRVVAASPWANMASRWQIQNSSTVVPCATPSIPVVRKCRGVTFTDVGPPDQRNLGDVEIFDLPSLPSDGFSLHASSCTLHAFDF